MMNSQSSRRNFLGSLAILSAGSVLSSFISLVPETPATDLYRGWKQFCRQNGGQSFQLLLPVATTPVPCRGHWYETGDAIAFPRYNLLAQPTWIFWSETKSKPADMFLTLYENDADKTRLGRLNRFEWEALVAMPERSASGDVIALMKKAGKSPAIKGETSLPLKVVVRKGRHVHITADFNQKNFTVTKQFLYSV